MKHDQKYTEPAKGDCFTACLMMLLGRPYDAEGDCLYEEMEARQQDGRWGDFLMGYVFGKGFLLHVGTHAEEVPAGQLAIAGGPSPRGNNRGHAVMMIDGEVHHDPHPSRDGLAGDVEEWWWLEPFWIGQEQGEGSGRASSGTILQFRTKYGYGVYMDPEVRPTIEAFSCPKCGTQHHRGPVNGDLEVPTYRCLACGWSGTPSKEA